MNSPGMKSLQNTGTEGFGASDLRLRDMQYKDKMALLNKNFVHVVQAYVDDCVYYDLTPTVESYIKHVQGLVEMYLKKKPKQEGQKSPIQVEKETIKRVEAGKESREKQSDNSNTVLSQTITPSVAGRTIARAKRRLDTDSQPSSGTLDSSTPSAFKTAPPRPSFGNMSAIEDSAAKGRVSFGSIVEKTTVTESASKPSSAAETTLNSSTAPPSAAVGRKRAIRGGGVLGDTESVIFKSGGGENKESSYSGPSIPPMTTNLPKPTPGFWKSKPAELPAGGFQFGKRPEEMGIKPTDTPIFAFGAKKQTDDKDKEADETTGKKSEEAKSTSPFAKIPIITFGGAADTSATSAADSSATSNGSKKSESIFQFGQKTDDEPGAKKLAPSFPSFASTSPKTTDASRKHSLNVPTFGAFSSTSTGTPIFPSFSSTSPTATSTSDSSKPAPSTSIFGSAGLFKPSATPAFSSTLPPVPSGGFTFGKLSNSTESTNANGEDDKEEEYVPPKVEAVENAEPNAVLSAKCSVFKFTNNEYVKLGVGMLYVKEVKESGQKSVLIRAATAIGTVWLNSYITDAMKMSKADEKGEKMRLVCPTGSQEMTTLLLRFQSAKQTEEIMHTIDELRKEE